MNAPALAAEPRDAPPPVAASAPPPGDRTVSVERLEKQYGGTRAVDGVDFFVGRGEVFAFLGPNGAGKTTTVEILEGLRRASAGTVRVLGRDPWTQSESLKRRVGVIPQDFHFFARITPREAIRLYARLFAVRVDADELLARVELSDKADAHYEDLSGGQHQKLGVALALVNDPEVCFLDEPTTGLDPRARRSIWEVVRRLRAEGRSVFLTTHYLEEAERLADRIAVLHLGRIIASGAPAEIIRRFGRSPRLRIEGGLPLRALLVDLGYRPVEENGAVEVELNSKEEALRILESVAKSGVGWTSFATRHDSLEDVFLRLVGPLEDGSVRRAASPEVPR